MERGDIEHLLLDFASGEISSADRQKLEQLFNSDPLLKQEADEMLQVWVSIRKSEENTVAPPSMDAHFYTMLEAAKTDFTGKKGKAIVLSPNFIKLLVASAACIIAFVIGRASIQPEKIISYKTVYVKIPGKIENIQTDIQRASEVRPAGGNSADSGRHRPKPISIANYADNHENTELRQKLRSVYASERVDAVNELSGKKHLDDETLNILGVALHEDTNPNVRLMIVNTLQPLANQENVQRVLIAALNQQNDSIIQASIVDLLVAVKSKQAIPQMITLMQNRNTDLMVQERIKDGIEKFL